MPEWNNLPFEVLLNIFKELEHDSDVCQCQCTCKGWSLAAQERIYKHVLVVDVLKVVPFINSIAIPYNKGGNLIKSIHFFLDSSFTVKSHLLNQIAQFCPNLESLISPWSLDIWKEMVAHYEKGHFKRLKELDVMIATKDSDYIATMLAYRKTMTKLFLMNDESKQYSQLVQYLPTFPKLTDLTIQFSNNDYLLALEPLINDCGPLLNSITFRAHLQGGGDARLNLALNKNMDLVSPRPQVKKIDIGRIYVTNDIIDYLIHKFPQPTELLLNEYGGGSQDESSVFELSTNGDNSMMSKFFKYMSKMSSFRVCGRVQENNIPNIMLLYKNIFTNNDNLTVRFNYADYRYAYGVPCMVLEKSLLRYNIPKRIKISKPKDTAAHTVLNVIYRKDYDVTELPHLNFARQYGANIREISLLAGCRERRQPDDYDFVDAVMFDNFKRIFQDCPIIEALTIEDMNFTNEEGIWYEAEDILPPNIKNESLEILVFKDCKWYANSEYCPRLARCLPSLKYLEFDDCEWMTTPGGKKGLYEIDMPGISFENITIVIEYERRKRNRDLAFLQINQDHYYMIGRNGFCRLVGKDYFKSEPEIMRIDVYRVNCKLIKTFTLKFSEKDNFTFVNPII